MATKPETRFIQRVNAHLPLFGRACPKNILEAYSDRIFYEKMNNPYKAGVPDCWYGGTACDAWVEYKWVDKIPKHGICPEDYLTPLQADWLTSHSGNQHRACYAVIGTPQGVLVATHAEFGIMYLPEHTPPAEVNGFAARTFTGNFLTIPEFARFFYYKLTWLNPAVAPDSPQTRCNKP